MFDYIIALLTNIPTLNIPAETPYNALAEAEPVARTSYHGTEADKCFDSGVFATCIHQTVHILSFFYKLQQHDTLYKHMLILQKIFEGIRAVLKPLS